MTVAEFTAELEGWLWRQDQEMEARAWLAWHFLIPHQKKNSNLQPKDLLPERAAKKELNERREVSPVDRARALEDLKREMGVEE